MNALFVYKDGSIGQRAIERALPSYRIARRLPVSVLAAVEPSVDSISVTYDEYALRGRMLDERPIYCADGFDVVEAWAEILATQQDISLSLIHPMDVLGRQLRAFVARKHYNAFEVDYHCGPAPFTEIEKAKGIEHQGILKFGARVINVVPKSAGVTRPRWAT